jgi:hypothetical protein
VIGGLHIPLGEADRSAAPSATVLGLRATAAPAGLGSRSGPDVLRLGIVRDGSFEELATLDGRYISTEVAGGFTGRVVGLSPGSPGGIISRFEYRQPSEQGQP